MRTQVKTLSGKYLASLIPVLRTDEAQRSSYQGESKEADLCCVSLKVFLTEEALIFHPLQLMKETSGAGTPYGGEINSEGLTSSPPMTRQCVVSAGRCWRAGAPSLS